ncbi:MAG: hypothetical protein RMK29_14110 [Myxococcales bacterium]|nr:hypothetical protein [Myxococcota bacterium]MDW8282845.1 hypothetical protein [Myxococcales bacterium]
MNPRSRHLPLRLAAGLLLATLPGGLSCTPPDGADLDAVERQRPGSKAGCEEATPALLKTNQNMLPGRDCGACHRAGGQATNSPFTVAGTVFAAPNAPCNPGGVANVYVEILDEKGDLQENGLLRTNGVGNFFTSARFTTPMKVRVREYLNNDPKPGKDMTTGKLVTMGTVVKEAVMLTPVGRGSEGNLRVNCAECHQFPGLQGAPGRVYLNAEHQK